MKSALALVLALSAFATSAHARTLSAALQIGDLSARRGNALHVVTEFVFPVGGESFTYRDGVLLSSSESTDDAPTEADTCTISRPFYMHSGLRSEYAELDADARIRVGSVSVWQDETTHLVGAAVRFSEGSFQITCYGTETHAPTLRDLTGHFGGAFEFVSR